MKTSIIAAVIIAALALGVFFAWSRTNKQTSLPKIPTSGFQQEITVSPTPTPTSTSSPATGVNLLLPLLGSASAGLTGWYLLRKI